MSCRPHSLPLSIVPIVSLLFAAVPGLAQDLTVTDGLQLWLKADAGVTTDGSMVLSWADQSPNAHVAASMDIPNAPIVVPNALNGKPVLRFDGIDDHLVIDDSESLSFSWDVTSFFVVNFTDFATYRAVWSKTSAHLPAPTDFYTMPDTGIPRLYRGSGQDAGLGFFDGGMALRANTYLTVGFEIADTQATHYLGGQSTSSGTLSAIAGDADTPMIIGSRADFVTLMKGDIAEIVIYDRVLSETERAEVVGYLGVKYGIANEPPTTTLAASPAGPTHAAGDVLTLNATATDTDGTIASVQFFANGNPVGTATAPPWTVKLRIDTPGAYEFSARATDNRDGTADSETISRTATAGPPPALSVTSNLQLWLKADAGITTGAGDTVVQWEDQSGQNNTAFAFDEFLAPVVVADAIGTQPAVRFDGEDDFLEIEDSESLSITGDITSFFVVRMDDFATWRAVWAKTNTNLPAPTDFYTLPNNGLPHVLRGNGIGTHVGSSGLRPLRAERFELVGFSATESTITHYLNGLPNGAGASTAITDDLDRPLFIGTRDDSVTRMKGDIAELLIYDTALSPADVLNVHLYLAGRYSFPLTSTLNDPPTVTVTAPAGGASIVAPADVTLRVDAADADGSVTRVEFFVNGALVATDLEAPWSATVAFTTASAASVQARATDNLGALTVSAPVSFTVTTPDPIPLPAPANLRLWLRADKGVTAADGVVSTWGDQSGNFNNAQQPLESQRPALVPNAINGHPVLRFDGIDDSLVAAHSPTLAITGDIASFFVVKFDDFETFRAVWGKTNAHFPAPNDFYTVPESGIPRIYRGDGSGGSLAFLDGFTAPFPEEYVILGFEMEGSLLRQFFNGEPNGEIDVVVTPGDTGAPLHIGTRGDQVTRMKGDIAEIVIYDAALSEEDREVLVSYLTARYAIGQPPTEIPVLTITPAIAGAVTISWPPGFGDWMLEFSPLSVPFSWQFVPGVVGNSYSEPVADDKVFRLRRP